MLVSQRPMSRTPAGHGCHRAAMAELRRLSAHPSQCENRLRQRLLILARRLARVQALGDEYARVAFSEDAERVLRPRAPAV